MEYLNLNTILQQCFSFTPQNTASKHKMEIVQCQLDNLETDTE